MEERFIFVIHQIIVVYELNDNKLRLRVAMEETETAARKKFTLDNTRFYTILVVPLLKFLVALVSEGRSV